MNKSYKYGVLASDFQVSTDNGLGEVAKQIGLPKGGSNGRKNDPVFHCDIYKNEGCAHVDGVLCDMQTCNELLTYLKGNHTKYE